MTGEVILIPDGEHSKTIGASSAERGLMCLGSTLLPGPSEQTEYAAFGTASHALSEWSREGGKPASHWKGKVLQVGEFSFPVGKMMIDCVQTFVDSCEKLPGVPFIEGRVAYEELVPGGFGTLDDARVQDGVCVVTDLKAGKGVQVFAHDNMQMKLYALGLFFTYGWMFEFDKFILRISQPRLRHFEEWPVSLGKLLEWGYDWVRPRAKLALTPGQPLTAGSWCKFCKAKKTCSVRAQYQTAQATGTWHRDASEEFVNLDE